MVFKSLTATSMVLQCLQVFELSNLLQPLAIFKLTWMEPNQFHFMECTHAFWLKYLSSTEISLYEILIPCPQDPPRVDALPALPEVHWGHTDQVTLCSLVPENPRRWLRGSLLLSCSICHGNNLHSLAVALFVAEHRDQLCCLWHSAEQLPVTLKLNERECIGHFT